MKKLILSLLAALSFSGAALANSEGPAWDTFPKERLTDEALAVAEKIARIPPIAVRVELESYYRGMDKSRVDAAIDGAHLYRMQHLGDSTAGILPSFISRTKKP